MRTLTWKAVARMYGIPLRLLTTPPRKRRAGRKPLERHGR